MDREKVIKGLECCSAYAAKKCTNHDCPYWLSEGCCIDEMLYDALAMLKEQEARKGKWERQYSRPGVYANLFWWCSVCGEPTRYNDAGIFYKYCPHCGAKLEPCIET